MEFSKSKWLFSFFVLCFLFACKKEPDDIFGPKITFNSPSQNQFFNVMSSVTVNATIKDDTKITSVNVSLVDALDNPVHVSVSVPVSSPSMEVNMQYILNNIHLESGMYSIMITASDGKNDTKSYQPIYLGALPKVVKKVLVVSATSTSQTNLSSIDSAFTTMTPVHVFQGDYIGSSASSYYQQGYVCGNYTGNLSCINLADNTIKFSVSSNPSAWPYFTGYFNTEKLTYVSKYDGTVRGYDYTVAISYNAVAEAGFYIQHFCFNDGFMVSEEQDKTSAAKRLLVSYATGVAEQGMVLSQDVVTFCEMDPENVFMFGNNAGQGVIQLFDRLNNHIWNPYNSSLPAGSLLSAVEIDSNTYLIALSNGTIYKYEYQNSSLTPYLTGYTANKLKYDFENNEVYVVEANTVSTFDYPTKTFHHSIASTEPILDIHLVYNR